MDLSGISLDNLESDYVADGIFTDSSEIALDIRPADCTVMVYHSANGENCMGLIHGGYLGIEGDIHLAALETITKSHRVSVDDARIFFAPQIRAKSYFFKNIRPEQLAGSRWVWHIYQNNGHYHIDLLSRIVTDLTENGIDPSQ